MTVKTGSAWAGLFVTLDATGALAAGTPSGVLYVDGVADAATVTITGSNPYKWAVTLPTLTAGQRVDMYITATISTIATAGVVASEQADTAILSDGVVVNSGTVTNLTNLPSIPADWLTAAGVKADAVTKIQTGLALEATLTAIKGAGWTDETLAKIVADIAAISAGSGASVTDIMNALLASYTLAGSVGEALNKIDDLPEDVYDEMITIPAVAAAVPADGELDIYYDSTLHFTISDLGSLANLTALYVTMKEDLDDEDSEAILQLEQTQGLLVVNGATATASDGSITIDDAVDGDITVNVAAAVMEDFSMKKCHYDVKIIRNVGVPAAILSIGTARFHKGVTKAIT